MTDFAHFPHVEEIIHTLLKTTQPILIPNFLLTFVH